MSQGYFAALAGDTEDDLVELVEPSIGIEYSPGKYVAKKQGKGKQACVFFRQHISCETENLVVVEVLQKFSQY